MPDVKISAGADPVTLVGTDKVPVARSASTTAYAATMTEVAAFASTGRAPLASPVFTGDPQAPTPPAGDSDTSIATTQFVTAAVATSLHNVGRNYLHNSMFNVAQRGAGAWIADTNFTADRWKLRLNSDTVSVGLFPANDALRAQVGDEAVTTYWQNVFTGSAVATAFNALVQSIEGVRRLAGKTVTLSFWASASAALKVGINYTINYGTGGSPSTAIWANPTGQSVTTSTAWTRYSVTTTLPTSATKTLGSNNDDRTELWLIFSSGANNNVLFGSVGVQGTPGTVQLWGVQLELGTVATPLEKLDPVTQLQQCQRFYQVGSAGITGYNTAGSSLQCIAQFPVTMRAIPATFTNTGVSQTNCTGAAVAAFGGPGSYSITASVTATGAASCFLNFTASADL